MFSPKLTERIAHSQSGVAAANDHRLNMLHTTGFKVFAACANFMVVCALGAVSLTCRRDPTASDAIGVLNRGITCAAKSSSVLNASRSLMPPKLICIDGSCSPIRRRLKLHLLDHFLRCSDQRGMAVDHLFRGEPIELLIEQRA